MTDTIPLGQLVVRLKVPVKNMPVGTELGYKDVPDAIAALGSAAFFDVVRDQQGNPIPPLTPEEIEAAQRAAQRRAKSRRLILGADFDPLWNRVEGIPSAEELTDMQAAVDAVADVPPRVEAVETALPLAMTRVNAAGYSTLQAALNAGAGKTVYIGPGQYSISAPLTPAAGTTVELHPNAVIEQTAAWNYAWDIFNAPGVQIIGGQFEWNGSRVHTPPGSYRGSSGGDKSSAIWSNSDRTRIIGSQIYGFLRGVFLQGWDGAATVDGYVHDPVIDDVEVDAVQTGFVLAGTTNARIHRGRGSCAPFTDGAPGHLVYATEHGGTYTRNVNPNVSDCYQESAAPGSGVAYQFKGITGGVARNLYAGTVPWLLHLMTAKDFVIDGIGAQSCTDTVGYAVSVEASAATDVERCSVRNVALVDLATGLKPVDLRGTDNDVRDVKATITTTTSAAAVGAVYVRGDRNTVENINITEKGTGGLTTVLVSGTNARVINPRTNKAEHLVRVTSGDAFVSYDPQASGSVGVDMLRMTTGANARLVLPPIRASSSGNAVTPNPSRQTTTAVSATGSTLSVNNPVGTTATVGAQHTIEIANASGGSLTVTWGAQYAFGPAWVSPAPGKTTFITFQYNGTTWSEVSRTA